MKAEDILHAHELDIVFDGRHKQYGAYVLRRFYQRRLLMAISLVFLLAAAISLAGYWYKPTMLTKKADIETIWGHVLPELEKKDKKVVEEKKQDMPKKPQQENVKTEKYVANIQVVDKTTKSDKLPDNLDSAEIDNKKSDGLEPGLAKVTIPKGPPVTGFGDGPMPPADPPVPPTPLDVAEVMPSYPGGVDALRKFLERNLKSPSNMEPDEAVTVKIKFVVGIDGKLQSFETVQDGGPAFTNEVVRVLKKMPAWNPGKSNGKHVSVYYILPVQFAAQD